MPASVLHHDRAGLTRARVAPARASVLGLALLAHLATTACGASGGTNPDGPGEAVAALILGGAPQGSMLVGETAQLSATTLNASGGVVSNAQVQWTTSDPSVALVSAGGLVTAVGGGQATVTAKSGTATASSNVSVNVGVAAGPAGGTMTVLNSTVTLTVPPQTLQQTTTILFAPTPSPPTDARLVPGTAVTIGPENLFFIGGATLKLKYDKAKLPANVTQASLEIYSYFSGAWRSIGVGTVDSATQTVTGVIQGRGTYAIIGTPIARIAIAPEGGALVFVGRTRQLTATTLDASNRVLPGRAVAWSSANGAVATVDAAGKVTGVSAGMTTVTASSEGVTATTGVTVFAAANTSATGTHPAGVIDTTFALSGRPHGVAITAAGQFCISQIDASSLTCGIVSNDAVAIEAPVPVGATPAHVALSADGTRAYTANQSGNSMSVVDLPTSTTIASVPLSSGGFNVLADPGSSRVYVTTATGMLHVVDATTRSVVAQVEVGAGSNGLALDRTRGLLYVSSISAGTVTVINTSTNAIVTTFTVSGMPQRIALSADGMTLFIATEAAGLELLDVATGNRVTVPGVFTGAVGLALSPDGQKVYVTNPPSNLLQIVDVATRQVTTLGQLARPRNVAFGLSGAVVLVTGEGGVVYVIR